MRGCQLKVYPAGDCNERQKLSVLSHNHHRQLKTTAYRHIIIRDGQRHTLQLFSRLQYAQSAKVFNSTDLTVALPGTIPSPLGKVAKKEVSDKY